MNAKEANSLRNALLGLQGQLAGNLKGSDAFDHSVAKGDDSESHWLEMFNNHLPGRYGASNGFVVDCEGNRSDQIDVIIFDNLYSPKFYTNGNDVIIPAESVYAIFEVKQTLNRANIIYAASKLKSVRSLRRYSAPVRTIDGADRSQPAGTIFGGLLARKMDWSSQPNRHLLEALSAAEKDAVLALGCAIEGGGFRYLAHALPEPKVSLSGKDEGLAFFFLSLLQMLQDRGTVPALDYRRYSHGFSVVFPDTKS